MSPKEGHAQQVLPALQGKGWAPSDSQHQGVSQVQQDGQSRGRTACKSGDAKQPSKKGGDKQMAYLMATIESLMKKGLKNAMKSKKRKHNRAYDSPSSSDSNSE